MSFTKRWIEFLDGREETPELREEWKKEEAPYLEMQRQRIEEACIKARLRKEKDMREIELNAIQESEDFVVMNLVPEENHEYTDEEALEEFGDPYDVF